ncbi:MAG TPA: polysaccharide biosynthesis tyrosine autokinase [Bacteroidia bacterium]|nr:polysaccharide biosynthesis tyrosine autokinase [Bacteroidia bacterium]HNT79072.1 polysaccharide biosynthesis tyrosine autokinase [Bacteroidia bacterium]
MSASSQSENNNVILDQNEIKKFLLKIVKNWFWFVLFIAIGAGLSVAYLYKAIPKYGVSASILVKEQKNALEDAFKSSLTMSNNRENLANETKIITSTRLIEKVVDTLKLDISYHIKGRIKTGEVYKGTPFKVVGQVHDPELYGVPFNVTIQNATSFKLEVIKDDYLFTKIGRFNEPIVTDKFSVIIEGNTDQIKSNARINEIEYLFIVNNRNYLIRKYQKALTVKLEDEASVINLSLEDEVTEKTVDFLNMLVDLYIENSVSVMKQVNENTLAFIDRELEEVANSLNSVEGNLEQFQRQKSLIDPNQEQSAYFQRMMDVDAQRSKLNVQLNALDQIYRYLTSGDENMAIAPSLLADQNDASLNSAFNELYTLQQRRTNLLFSNTPNSPVVKELDNQISSAKQNVIGMVLNIRKTIVTNINSLSSQAGQFQGAIRQMPTITRGLVNISRKVEIFEKIYLFLLETRSQTIIARAGIVADKTIIESAKPNGVVKPAKEKILFMGIAGGIAIAFLLIFVKSLFYNYIQTKDDLKELTTQPIIGVIARSKEAGEDYLVVDKYPQSPTAEAFRVIRTNLTYFSPKSESKIVLITSSLPAEGKSFTAVNLASILARAKKKVILLDIDLHKPKQANAFDIQNDVGLTTYLVGKANMNQIIKETPIQNLQIILTGPRTPNAAELILDNSLVELFAELRKHYEYIILDTAPVGLISDTLYLMKYSDINLYVLKAGFSKRDFVDIAHQIMDKNQVKSMNFILNNVNPKHIPGGYGSGYYK